jgi:hypothetical protein
LALKHREPGHRRNLVDSIIFQVTSGIQLIFSDLQCYNSNDKFGVLITEVKYVFRTSRHPFARRAIPRCQVSTACNRRRALGKEVDFADMASFLL